MNSLEAEYSFLAPTWKLPIVATTSMYSRTYGTKYATDPLDIGPDSSLWNNTMYNSRYIPSYVPSTTFRRNYPVSSYQKRIVPPYISSQQQQNNQIPGETATQSGPPYYQQSNNQYGNDDDDGFNSNNEYEAYNNISNYNRPQQHMVNRGLTYSTNGQNYPRPPPGQNYPPPPPSQNYPHPPPGQNYPPPPPVQNYPRPPPGQNYPPPPPIQNYTHSSPGQNYPPPPPIQNYPHPSPGQNYPPPPPSQNYPHPPPGQNYPPSPPGQNYPPPPPGQKRRVQIIDQNRQTPSTVDNGFISGRDSHNSTYGQSYPTPDVQKSPQKSRSIQSNQNHTDENRFGYHPNNTNIHEYLYGPSAPDPGSYTNTFKNHQRRLQEEKLGRKSVMSEYKSFAQNGGFGPSFGNQEHQSYEEKIDTEKKRKNYAKSVRETNQQKFEEQKRNNNNNNGQQKTRPVPVPKYQRAKEYADKIEKPHNLKPVSETEFSSQIPILITSLSNKQRCSSLDSVLSDFNINRSRRSSSVSSIRIQRRVRFGSRDFIRRRSSTCIDLPSYIIGKSILFPTNSSSTDYHIEKSSSKILEEQEKFNFQNEKNSSNKIEKKIITSHSMNMRLPPTANVIINQTYKPSIVTTTTTTTNNQLKKSYSNKDIRPSPRLLTARSIPSPYRKSTTFSNPNFDLKIKSFHHTDDENNSSNE